MQAIRPLEYAFVVVANIKKRFELWLAARTPQSGTVATIVRKRIYIVPTRFGYGFALLLLVMLLGAMNYSNSMAFAFTFLLMGLGLLAMHHTHANLLHLSVKASANTAVFCGDIAHFRFNLSNPSSLSRRTVHLYWTAETASDFVDIDAHAMATIHLTAATSQRGYQHAPRFAVATEYPLGLLHAWTWLQLDSTVLVYPSPSTVVMEPPRAQGSEAQHANHRHGVDEFAGLRRYAPGDSLASVHWKSFAKTNQPQVKNFVENQSDDHVFDFDQIPLATDEAKLSQLCRWVLDAESAQRAYTVILRQQIIGPGQGPAHQAQCLRALALYPAA